MLRVLSADLRSGRVKALLRALQAGLALPGSLQIVPHVNREASHPINLELDLVAVHERGESAMVGATRQNVPGDKRVDGADPRDAFGDLMSHVIRVVILH